MRIEMLEDDLSGNVKKLSNHTPEYRMRTGNWRVLFEIESSRIIIISYFTSKGVLQVSIHPQVIEKEGKKEFVVLPYEEFLVIKELLEDFEDLKDLREAKADSGDKSTVELSDIKKDLLKDRTRAKLGSPPNTQKPPPNDSPLSLDWLNV